MLLELIDKYFLQAFSKEMEAKKDRAELVYIFNILFFRKPVFNRESLYIKFDRLKILARQKPVFALDIHVILGLGYSLGVPVTQDIKEALEHFTLAAEQNYAPAQFLLGCHLADETQWRSAENKRAIALFKESATQGKAYAQHALGYIVSLMSSQEWYEMGNAIADFGKDQIEFEKRYLVQAVEAGFAPAQFLLGKLYLKLRYYVPQNFSGQFFMKNCKKQGLEHFRLAANQGHVEAYEKLGGMTEDKKEAQKDWWAAAKLGSSSALLWLGDMEDKSFLLRKRAFPKAALECYFQAVKLGNLNAQTKLANLNMENGNYEEALRYAQMAMAHDYKLPCGALFFEMEEIIGFCHFYGLGIQQDFKRAFEYFQSTLKIAAVMGPFSDKCLKMVHYHLGIFYKEGLGGVEQDPKAAFECFFNSIERTTPTEHTPIVLETEQVTLPRDALTQLGICYENGYGTDRDVEKALQCYTRASETGSVEAKDHLVRLKAVQEKLRADQHHPAAATAAGSKMRR